MADSERDAWDELWGLQTGDAAGEGDCSVDDSVTDVHFSSLVERLRRDDPRFNRRMQWTSGIVNVRGGWLALVAWGALFCVGAFLELAVVGGSSVLQVLCLVALWYGALRFVDAWDRLDGGTGFSRRWDVHDRL